MEGVEPVEQVFSEFARLTSSTRSRLVAATRRTPRALPIRAALRLESHAAIGLNVQWQLTYLIEKQRAVAPPRTRLVFDGARKEPFATNKILSTRCSGIAESSAR